MKQRFKPYNITLIGTWYIYIYKSFKPKLIKVNKMSYFLKLFIVPVYAVLWYTVTKHELCRVCKRRKSIPFIYDESVVSLRYDGNKKSPTRKFWDVLDSLLCTLPSASADFTGLVILWEWVTSEFQTDTQTWSANIKF